MKTNPMWNRSGRTIAPVFGVFGVFAALVALVLLAGTPTARAQGPATDDHGGGEFEIEIDGEGAMDFEEFDDGPLAMHGPGGPDMARLHGMGGGGGGGGMRGGMRGRHAEMMEKLNLTEKQKDQMADLRDAQERKMLGIKSGLAEARLDMRKLMRADTPSQAQIDATIDRTAKLRADAQKKTMDEMRSGRMKGASGAPRNRGDSGGGKRGA